MAMESNKEQALVRKLTVINNAEGYALIVNNIMIMIKNLN